MQAAEPVEEEPAFLDLLVRDAGERELPSVMYQLQAADDPVPVPMQAAVAAWTDADVIPIAIRPAEPLLLSSQLELAGELQHLADSIAWAEQPEYLSFDALALEPAALEPIVLEPIALAPHTLKRSEEHFVFVEPAEPVAIAEPVVIIERGLLERLALKAQEAVLLQPEPPMVEAVPVAEPEPVREETAETVDSGPVPPFAGWQHHQASFEAAWIATASVAANDSPEPEFSLPTIGKPVLAAAAPQPFSAGLESAVELSLEAPEVAPQPRPATLTWFRLGALNPPLLIGSSLIGSEPRVRLAGGCRYAMKGLSPAMLSNSPEALSF
jgi:hypothetical protein